jgi:hypothetical protein
VYKDLPDALAFTSRSLKTGSGVKCIFSPDFKLPTSGCLADLTVGVGKSHKDYDIFSLEHNGQLDLSMSNANLVTIVVQDSMETVSGIPGDCGIIDSWGKVFDLLMAGTNVHLDLTNLRPAGSSKADGYNVTSSGPTSFAHIYKAIGKYANYPTMLNLLKLQGTLNEVILKGGFKRGIVTSMMHVDCDHIDEYLDAPTADLDGSHKKGVIVTKALAVGLGRLNSALRAKICDKVNTESIFLQKCTSELSDNYNGTYSNVCVGIMLPDRGTCLIWRINLGLVETRDELVDAFVQATKANIALHKEWHDNCPKALKTMWQPIENDRQVAIDVVGLANMLKRFECSYLDFVTDLETANKSGDYNDGGLVQMFAEAYRASTAAAQVAAEELGLPSFLRLHTVEPAQSHAFELTDYEGATLARGIWPPFDQMVNRISDNEQTITVDHGDVETLADVGPDLVFRLNAAWQTLMADNGLPHAISADSYSVMGETEFHTWWQSSMLTQYYQFSSAADQSYARKQVEELDIETEPELDKDDFLSGFGAAAKSGPKDISEGKVCMLDPTQAVGCSVCAE